MTEDRSIIEIVSGLWLIVITTLIGYNTKRIGEIPEKYVAKNDFNIIKVEIIDSLKRIHDRLDKLVEERREPRE